MPRAIPMKKVAIVTGSNKGIGFEIVKGLAKIFDGDVYLTSRNEARGLEAVKALSSEGINVMFHQLDIGDKASVAKLASDIGKAYGGIDILVNNASAINLTDTLTVTMKTFDLMHQINTRGTFLMTKTVIPHLNKAENPHVLNLSPPLNMEARWFSG